MQVEKRPIRPQRFQQILADGIVRKAQAGDMNAHSEIYKMYSQAVLTLARGFCRNQQCAEDVLHNTFIKLINKISLFEGRAPFGMWLRQIAVNESLIYLRKHKKHKAVFSTDEDDFFETEQSMHIGFSNRGGEDHFTEQHGTCDELSSILRELPEHVRLVLWLKEVEGYTHEEIAVVVNKTPSYSKSLVARSYKFLRTRVVLANSPDGLLT